jgi:class 3 adenylate cyclase
VLCPHCSTENRAERRWCGNCGKRLPYAACDRCSFLNTPTERFCGGCGLELRAASVELRSPSPVGEAERRQLTVMFADLVGSTALANELDAEDLRELIGRFQGAASSVIERFDGFVARYMGDGILAYFGYPQAHEDDAERATRAGLALVDAVKALGASLEVRVGLATGQVIAGDLIGAGRSEERAVVGETPNLAARLQAIAEPGTVVLSDRTRRLVEAVIEVSDLGLQQLKGFPEAERAWRALAPRTHESRFEARRGSLAPFVGRTFELRLLAERWEQATRGSGQVVVLSGEAGVGKSRIVHAFLETLVPEPRAITLQCSPHHEGTALHPVLELLARLAAIHPSDPADVRAAALARWLGAIHASAQQVGSLGLLLGLPETVLPAVEGGPEDQRRAVFATVWLVLESLVAAGPLVVVLEDLQWADDTTSTFLAGLVERVPGSPLLVLATHRPEHVPGWPAREHIARLAIGRITDADAFELVRGVVGDALDRERIDRIVQHAEGVPAYAEEIARAVTSAPAGQAPVVPETLHDSLRARLDRLPRAREVVQHAAVLGREFSLELLSKIWTGSPAQLDLGLRDAIEAGIVTPPGLQSGALHAFRHGLLRDVAYESLLHRTRRMIHGRVAQALAEHPLGAEAPEIVARHFTDADRKDEALGWWLKAAEQARARAAVIEHTQHLRSAIDVLAEAATTDRNAASEKARLHVELALTLRLVLRTDEAFQQLVLAEAIATEHDFGETLAHVHFARGNLHFLLGNVPDVRREHEMSLAIARRIGSPVAEVRALGGLADACMAAGRLAEGLPIATACIERAEALGLEEIVVANLPLLAYFQAYLLDYDAAIATSALAVERARKIGMPRSASIAMASSLFALTESGQLDRAAALAQELLDMSRRLGGYWVGAAVYFEMRRLRVSGHYDESVALARASTSEGLTQDAFLSHALIFAAAAGDPSIPLAAAAAEVLQRARDGRRDYQVYWAFCEGICYAALRRDWSFLRQMKEGFEQMGGENGVDVVTPSVGRCHWELADTLLRWQEDPSDPLRLEAVIRAAAPVATLRWVIRGIVESQGESSESAG